MSQDLYLTDPYGRWPMASMAHGEPGEEDPEAGGPTEQGDGVGPVVSHGDLLKDEHNGMAEL